MALVVPVSEAKTRLTELLRRVEDGEYVVITRNGREVAELVRRRAPDRLAVVDSFAGEIDGDAMGPVPEFHEWEHGAVGPTT